MQLPRRLHRRKLHSVYRPEGANQAVGNRSEVDAAFTNPLCLLLTVDDWGTDSEALPRRLESQRYQTQEAVRRAGLRPASAMYR